ARVSLMRTLLARPRALLLDEPFSKLDAVLRVQFRAFVFEQIEQLQLPTLLVTHDAADVPPGARVLNISDWQVGDA
ncbi:MAG: sulfate ABC transporter ATP-binding protein, partial [Comamonadaceae bacterium CG17_big_fil_post_rev_8_21_14_2_50_60_13]